MADKTFTLDECKKHASDKDCWLVVHGKVYNVTDFLEEHPGGYDIILTSAGGRGAMERRAKCCVNAPAVTMLGSSSVSVIITCTLLLHAQLGGQPAVSAVGCPNHQCCCCAGAWSPVNRACTAGTKRHAIVSCDTACSAGLPAATLLWCCLSPACQLALPP